MIFLCVLIFKLSLQGELCPWLPTCRWGRHILSGVAHCVVESLGHCFVFLQEKAVALPPRTGGGLISSGTIRFASTTLDGTRDYWLLGSFSEKVLKCLENHLKNDETFNPGRRQVVTRVVWRIASRLTRSRSWASAPSSCSHCSASLSSPAASFAHWSGVVRPLRFDWSLCDDIPTKPREMASITSGNKIRRPLCLFTYPMWKDTNR